MGELQGLDEFFIGQLGGLAFDHGHFGGGADVDEVQIAVGPLFLRWIDDELTVDPADAHGSNRAFERNVRDAQGGGGAVDAEDIRIIDLVSAQEQGDDLGVKEIILGEKRTQGAVRHPADNDFFFSRTTFPLEITTGESAGGAGFFFVLDGQRKPILTWFQRGGRNGRNEDDRVAAADGDSAVSQFAHLAGFKDDGGRADLARDGVNTHV